MKRRTRMKFIIFTVFCAIFCCMYFYGKQTASNKGPENIPSRVSKDVNLACSDGFVSTGNAPEPQGQYGEQAKLQKLQRMKELQKMKRQEIILRQLDKQAQRWKQEQQLQNESGNKQQEELLVQHLQYFDQQKQQHSQSLPKAVQLPPQSEPEQFELNPAQKSTQLRQSSQPQQLNHQHNVLALQQVTDNSAMPYSNHGGPQSDYGDNSLKHLMKDKIHLSVVCCGNRLEEATVMLKSAIMFTQTPMHLHIFAEDQLQEDMANRLNGLLVTLSKRLSFNIYPITFPSGEDPNEWKKIFKLCATQRLFLPDLLKNVDSVLYVDTDVLFKRPMEMIWNFFSEFNQTQFAAMTPEYEVSKVGWYYAFSRHPFYGMTGLNSGVMLMNLTRMRTFAFTNRVVSVYREYQNRITWGDQDLLNIMFFFHPECVYLYPCEWNFRPDACSDGLICHRLKDHGVSVLHGNTGVYHNDKERSFRVIYEAFRTYEFGTDLETELIQRIRQQLSNPNLMNLNCTKAILTPVIDTLCETVSDVNSKLFNKYPV